jgi:hypothetical protein
MIEAISMGAEQLKSWSMKPKEPEQNKCLLAVVQLVDWGV